MRCKACGREIHWNGKCWDHTGQKLRHIAIPDEKIPPVKFQDGVYINNKTGDKYFAIGTVTDCTNSRNGVVCVLYHRHGDSYTKNWFVREEKEFREKFTFNRN
jgi:hypothetical protein